MNIERSRFCINRKIAPTLSIDRFFKLVQRLGLNKVELRNDMPGGKVTDGLSYMQIAEMADKCGLDILTINAVYPFNQLNEETLKKTEGLLRDARGVGAKALVLCPLNDGTPISDAVTIAAIKQLSELFATFGIQGFVEPLGFPFSSLRSAVHSQHLIQEAGSTFKIMLDTFHHHLYEDAEKEFAAHIDIAGIGLVHLSGVEDQRPTTKLTDEERVMLTDKDVMENYRQVKRLEEMNYRGDYSFEPFSSTLADWNEAEIEKQIEHSIELLLK
ncbi:TIM barrel protein [Citrobacter braakii]|jgi:2-keto-myo-inositol isomerase|uniref:TIM barrel protein n=1 Tax=Citrobacter braakii TaxID=57706 RepID=UPI003D994F6F